MTMPESGLYSLLAQKSTFDYYKDNLAQKDYPNKLEEVRPGQDTCIITFTLTPVASSSPPPGSKSISSSSVDLRFTQHLKAGRALW